MSKGRRGTVVLRRGLLICAIVALAGGALAQSKRAAKEQAAMQSQFINPDGLSKPTGYTHVVIPRPGKLAYISGQVALNAKGELVGKGDLRAQVTQDFENLKVALAAAGGTLNDIVKLNYYVVNVKPEQLPAIREVRNSYISQEHPPASTLVGVTALARDDFMIEIEAVAVVK